MSYIRKNGPSRTALSEDVDASLARFQKSQGSESGSPAMDEEAASAVRAARGAVQDVVNIIAIQTMLVWVRKPASRNSSEEERKWLGD
eukprot:7815771-Lingulodinium_polyedra.AAC.1